MPPLRLAPALAGLAVILALAVFPAAPLRAAGVPEPDGYRMEAYKAPVPDSIAGGRVVDTDGVAALAAAGAVLIDALPKPPRPALPAGTVFHDKLRDDIPGSVWLPDVGYGALSVEMEGYFRDNLARLTGGDKSRPLVFYCLADCWMSWNAARRAIAWGYTGVAWYPGGTDAWAAAGRPLERRTPVPRPGLQE